MSRYLLVSLAAVTLAVMLPMDRCGGYPRPDRNSAGTWRLDRRFRPMRMISVPDPVSKKPMLYWYLIYTVTNDTDQQTVRFNPDFTLLTDKLKVHRDVIDMNAFAAIKRRHKGLLLKSAIEIAGPLQRGVGYAKTGVAIFRGVDRETDSFKVFVSGLSDDSRAVKNPVTGKSTNLYWTLERSYRLPGDKWYIRQDDFIFTGERPIYR
jgi:hypothetical protein